MKFSISISISTMNMIMILMMLITRVCLYGELLEWRLVCERLAAVRGWNWSV